MTALNVLLDDANLGLVLWSRPFQSQVVATDLSRFSKRGSWLCWWPAPLLTLEWCLAAGEPSHGLSFECDTGGNVRSWLLCCSLANSSFLFIKWQRFCVECFSLICYKCNLLRFCLKWLWNSLEYGPQPKMNKIKETALRKKGKTLWKKSEEMGKNLMIVEHIETRLNLIHLLVFLWFWQLKW